MKAFLLAVPLLLCACVLAQGQPLLPQGDFERADAGGKPLGWELMSPGNTSLAGDEKNRWVRLRDGAILSQVVPLGAGAKTVVVSARLKLSGFEKGPEGWHRARVAMRFLDARGEMVGGYPPTPDVAGNSDWVTKQVTLEVPPNATQLQIQPGLWGSKGLLEIDDVRATSYAQGAIIEAAPAEDAPFPSAAPRWGSEPLQVQSPRRARVSLNGAWKFAPAQGERAPEAGWGYIQVPGSWRRTEDLIEAGKGASWAGFDGAKLSGAWFERRFKVPADWSNRRILLDFGRISTDATVWVNGKPAGKISYPEGELDITNLVTPGEEATVRALVVATLDQAEALVLMGNAPGQNYTAKAELQSAGIVGDVTLHARPRGAFVSDVWVQPSVRKKQLGIEVELSDVARSGPVRFVALVLDERGREAKRLEQTVQVKAAARQRVQVLGAWANPKLWDVGQPNLYLLRLQVLGAGVDDEPAVRFGFREVWVSGRDVFLNGTKFRIRPVLLGTSAPDGRRIPEAVSLGYNFGELWPEDVEARGRDARYTGWYQSADRAGFPISGILPHMGWLGGELESPERAARYRAAAERVMRRFRNHPSIVLWGTSGNMMGGALDPRLVGVRQEARRADIERSPNLAKAIPLAERGLSILKSFDRTRPIFIHNGGPTGDVYTVNNYLNFIPLQEREEWLSNYARRGDMPLMYVEFGTPVSLSLMRARNGFPNAPVSEIFLSEYCAAFLGPEAYALEPEAYRRRTREIFVKDQAYSWHLGMKERDFAPAWLRLQDEFIRATWRSWRTMGMTGGMIPWDSGYARLDGRLTPAGEALRASNSATLAWIAGAAREGDIAAFTSKDHSFFAREPVRKQIALLNDSRQPRKYLLRWSATLNNKVLARGTKSGALSVGQTLLVPLEFAAPDVSGKSSGSISLEATIGSDRHRDRFDLRVWPREGKPKGTVSVFDPSGKTSAMLRGLGYAVSPWDGRSSTSLLVIGRNALRSKPPGDWKRFVQGGGRVLISGHDPHWLRENLGVRVSHLQSRRVWKVGELGVSRGVARGLDERDLRDWRGSSALLEARPDYFAGKGPDVRLAPTNYPFAGWRWGTRGTVSSAAIEKPHRSGWRPLLEAEFDLAYSPLMELDFGRGKVVWSQLDLEDHALLDPAARKLALQVLGHAAKSPLAPRARTFYVGAESGRALLKSLGVRFESPPGAVASGLLIVGEGARIGDAQLENFARNGGQVLVLARQSASGALGISLQQKPDFIGSLRAPSWPEARGLSASDLRFRNASATWLIASAPGWEVASDGLLARRVVGKGVLLWAQLDPSSLPADEKTYLRLTRWRQTRALSQVLANLGAAFEMDARVFSPRPAGKPPLVSLAGEWRARQIQRLDAAPSPDKGHADPGISEEARRALAAGFDDSKWQRFQAPRDMDSIGPTWQGADGEAVFRREIQVPREMLGQDLTLSLGTLDDFDEAFFNGVRVGGIGPENASAYSEKREYRVPAGLARAGRNVLAIRVWDRFGGGGFTTGDAALLQLRPALAPQKAPGFYHADYREDWELGDEPYRYYNW